MCIRDNCTYEPETRGGDSPDGRKVKITIHFVSAAHAIDAEVRLYDRLFTVENPSDETGVNAFTDNLNKDSMIVLKNAKLESNLTNLSVGDKFQFLRLGYFCVDKDSTSEKPVFNRTVALKDVYKRQELYSDNVLYFPTKEYIFYNIETSGHQNEHARISVIQKLVSGGDYIVVTSLDAILQYTCDKEEFELSLIHI